MRDRIKAIVFFLAVGSIAGYFVYKEVTRVGEPGIINIGQQAPDFSIKDQSGHLIKLSDYRGKVVFLNIWGTWCEPCKREMPQMETMYQAFKGKKFQMLAVSIDNDWKEVNEFFKEKSLTLPVFLDGPVQGSFDCRARSRIGNKRCAYKMFREALVRDVGVPLN